MEPMLHYCPISDVWCCFCFSPSAFVQSNWNCSPFSPLDLVAISVFNHLTLCKEKNRPIAVISFWTMVSKSLWLQNIYRWQVVWFGKIILNQHLNVSSLFTQFWYFICHNVKLTFLSFSVLTNYFSPITFKLLTFVTKRLAQPTCNYVFYFEFPPWLGNICLQNHFLSSKFY